MGLLLYEALIEVSLDDIPKASLALVAADLAN